jgi:hypothetical protein
MTDQQRTPTDPCEQLRALLPAYSIGATDDNETRLVEQLLTECPEVAPELEDLAALSQAMLFTAPPMQPPAQLGSKILAAAAGPTLVQPLPAPPRRAFNPLIAGLAAVAALLILSNVYWITQIDGLRRQQQEALNLLDQRNEALVVASAADVRQIPLVTTAAGDTTLATVLWSPTYQTAVLRAEALPALEANRDYQLWLIPDGANPISAGTFRVDAAGEGVYVFQSNTPLDQFAAVGVSNEPTGGSPQPTTNPIAVGQSA